jgi:predicted kinase
MTERTYEAMIKTASDSLRRGNGMVLDATFSKRASRDRLRAALGNENLVWILAEADVRDTVERLRCREGSHHLVSDARLSDLSMLDAAFEAPDELPSGALLRFSTAVTPARSLHKLLTALATHRDSAIAGASA